MRPLRPALLAALLLLLAACGGGSTGNYGSGGSGNGGGNTVVVEGTWQGSYTITGTSGTTPIYAAIVQNGFAFFYDSNGVIYVLPTLTGSTTLSGTLTAFAPGGTTFTNGKSVETFALSGTTSSSAITGSFSGNGETGSFSLAPFAPLNVNPTVVSGNWHGFYVGSGSAFLALTMQPAGVFAGTDSNGCNFTGTLTQVAGENLFTVSVDSTGGPLCAGKLAGLAFESNTDAGNLFGHAAGIYYYVGVSNASGAFVAELKVQ